jgi:hypothetical protein
MKTTAGSGSRTSCILASYRLQTWRDSVEYVCSLVAFCKKKVSVSWASNVFVFARIIEE